MRQHLTRAFGLLLACCACAFCQDADFAKLALAYDDAIRPLLNTTCLDCHDADTAKGELDLERFENLAAIRKDPGVWQKVIEQIESGEMPPKDKKQLSSAAREALLEWAKNYLHAEALASAGDPGPVVLRRLNNAEYTHTVRDLTGIPSLDPAFEFPVDSAAGEGFTNTGAALVMSPALLEKYLSAGKSIAAHAVLLPNGFRFSESTTRQDWSNAIVRRIRSFYYDRLQTDAIDFGYRAGKEVGDVRPVDDSDGRVNLLPYTRALISHKDQLAEADFSTAVEIARNAGLNAHYFAALAEVLFSRSPQASQSSLLLGQLRDRLHAKNPDAESIVDWIRAWQDQLWNFQTVGHLGIIRPWQSPVTPISMQRDLQLKIESGQDQTLTLVASGLGKKSAIIWDTPRIVRGGKPPILLRDIKAAAAAYPRLRDEWLGNLADVLAAAFEAKRSDDTQERVIPSNWKPLFAYLGISDSGEVRMGDYLTGRVEQAGGQTSIQGWTLPGERDLSIMGNASDTTWNIPGESPPHRIVVHPNPQRSIAASWKSPIAGKVKIAAHVQHRHPACGNGVSWAVLHQRGSQLRVLRSGDTGVGGTAQCAPVDDFPVKMGDLLTIVIDARDKNHGCDLTEIELAISDLADGARVWSLSADCADSMLAGNPHGDRYGNLATWHFHSSKSDGGTNKVNVIPEGSLLARWLECEDADEAAEIAGKIQALMTNPVSPDSSEADAELRRQLTNPGGPIFSRANFEELAKSATPNEIAASPYGLESSMFDASGNLKAEGPSALTFRLPGEILEDAQFLVAGRIDDSGNSLGASQLQLIRGAAEPPNEFIPGIPITAPANSQVEADVVRALDDFRALFPAAMCYARIVPIDEVVTLVLYHREDEHLARLMLSKDERSELDRLWDELHYVSQDAFRIVVALEQILEFATQDADPRRFFPLKDPIAKNAAALRLRLTETAPAHLEALVDFASRAYRRPLTGDESTGLRTLYASLRSENLPHDEAFRLVLARIFASPAFLYKMEAAPAGEQPGPVTDWELATRLSYLLWSSTPDAELRKVADAGELRNGDALIKQAQRMLHDDRLRRFAVEFACQWLHVRDFDAFDEKSERHYPEFKNLRGPMYEETIQFFTKLFQNDESILSIIEADHTFLNPDLAEFYGIDLPAPEGWQRVEGLREKGRGGILGMATTLARQSGASRTSPILRGNWVSETLLGEKLPKPPADVPQLPDSVPEGLSERELIELHSSEPACAKCHARIDPYGFALEHFDAIGRLRVRGGDGQLIDSGTQLLDGTALNGIDGLRNYLANTRRDAFVRQFCRKLLGYALGRATRISDAILLDEMQEALAENDYRFRSALDCILRSRQFREIRGAGQNSL